MAPYVVSGSSDKHLRLFDITTFQGWSTSPEYEGDALADRWPLDDELVEVAARWDIHPGEQLVHTH